jgi:hypothetical protein
VEKGFFASLFDISFSSLVATKVIKVIYVLSMVLIGLTALVFVAGAFSNSVAAGLFTLVILAPLAALVYLIYVRVILEVIICVFRIMETNVELVSLQRAAIGTAAAPGVSSARPPTRANVSGALRGGTGSFVQRRVVRAARFHETPRLGEFRESQGRRLAEFHESPV